MWLQVQSTFSHTPDRGVHPLSPDGEKLAFLSKRTGKEAIFRFSYYPLWRDANRSPCTQGVQHFGMEARILRTIAYAAVNEPKNKAEIEKGYTAFEITNNDMFVSSQPMPAHIWLINTESGNNKRLTDGTWSLPLVIPPSAPSSPFSWSSDGKNILFVKVKSAYSGDGQHRTIQMFNVADSTYKPLTTRLKCEAYPNFSPDGSKISYWFKKDNINESINELWVTNAVGGEGKPISTSLNRDLYLSAWLPDNKSFLVGGHNDNKTSMWSMGLDGKLFRSTWKYSPSWGLARCYS